jgi:hypothetical protein
MYLWECTSSSFAFNWVFSAWALKQTPNNVASKWHPTREIQFVSRLTHPWPHSNFVLKWRASISDVAYQICECTHATKHDFSRLSPTNQDTKRGISNILDRNDDLCRFFSLLHSKPCSFSLNTDSVDQWWNFLNDSSIERLHLPSFNKTRLLVELNFWFTRS